MLFLTKKNSNCLWLRFHCKNKIMSICGGYGTHRNKRKTDNLGFRVWECVLLMNANDTNFTHKIPHFQSPLNQLLSLSPATNDIFIQKVSPAFKFTNCTHYPNDICTRKITKCKKKETRLWLAQQVWGVGLKVEFSLEIAYKLHTYKK